MKFADLYHDAIFWTCYLENYPDPERFLKIYGLTKHERVMFDHLGKFFPFEEFYVRGDCLEIPRAVNDLSMSKKSLILPWIYRPTLPAETLQGKRLICPSNELFTFLDNKIEVKKLLEKLGFPTPKWSFFNKGEKMLEKPIQNSAGGLGITLTANNSRDGYFLEDYIQGHRSIGMQFFVYDEVEFICANEMLFHSNGKDEFTFHAQKNMQRMEIPDAVIEDCFKLLEYLLSIGYKGFIGIDVLIEEGHFMLEINPRGIAFLPVFFAASAFGWKHFITYMKEQSIEQGEIILLDFGRTKKVVRKLQ